MRSRLVTKLIKLGASRLRGTPYLKGKTVYIGKTKVGRAIPPEGGRKVWEFVSVPSPKEDWALPNLHGGRTKAEFLDMLEDHFG